MLCAGRCWTREDLPPRGLRSPTAPAIPSKLSLNAARKATPTSSPNLERRRRKLAIVDYHIHHSSHPFVLYRVVVTENGVDRTLHRRYNDFAELHRSLVRACGLEATRGLELPGKRVFKRKKFEAAFLEERKAALNRYLQCVMASAELRISEPVRVFLSDAWRLHMEAVAGRRFSFLYPDNSFSLGRAGGTMALAADMNGAGGEKGGSPRTRSRSLVVPQSGNVLSPPQQRRASSIEERQIVIRPRGPRRPPVRKMPMPLNLKSDLYHPVYMAIPPRLLELRREFDTEKPYMARGTPNPRFAGDKTPPQQANLAPLPPPPKGFFDDHFPDIEVIKRQQQFLKEYHRRRFVKPTLPQNKPRLPGGGGKGSSSDAAGTGGI